MNQTERIKRKFLSRILYEYRQRFGVPADLYKVSVGTPNYETGNKSVTLSKIKIPQLITLTANAIKKFEYDISYIKANSNFAYGGFYTPNDRFMIVDGVYLDGQTIQQEDYIVYNEQKYSMQRIETLDAESGYMLHTRSTIGEQFNQIHEVYVRSIIEVEQEYELQ